jgi:hypothetical protein
MSWHFSQALVAEYSAEFSLDGEQFALLKETDLPEAYYWQDRTTESLTLFQYSTTSQTSTASLGAGLLTWYRADFLAKTSALQELCGDATAWRVSDPVYGGKCCELLARFDLPMFSVKTRLLCERQGCQKLSEDFPTSGMHLDGSLWELKVSDCITNVSDCGFMLPTPTARDFKDTFGMKTERQDGKSRLDRLPMLLFSLVRSAGILLKNLRVHTVAKTVCLKDLAHIRILGQDYCPELPEWVMGWPIGWTDLRPLEMDRFQQWLLSHGKYCT